MRICYRPKRFKPEAAATLELANEVIGEYSAAGYVLTLRQLYYQFVARDLFPDDRRWTWTGSRYVRDPEGTKNATPNYKWLGALVNDGRLAGEVDWDAIEDRTRAMDRRATWDDPTEILEDAISTYAVNPWLSQRTYVEVWIEKEALVGVLEPVCRELRVPRFACRGYPSQSEMRRAAVERFGRSGRRNVVVHLGDHDPSGVDMTRDLRDRFALFGVAVEVRRVALNLEQVELLDLPPNPAKTTDPRSGEYLEKFGDESWELDALEPAVLVRLIEDEVATLRDGLRWNADLRRERDDLGHLHRLLELDRDD